LILHIAPAELNINSFKNHRWAKLRRSDTLCTHKNPTSHKA